MGVILNTSQIIPAAAVPISITRKGAEESAVCKHLGTTMSGYWRWGEHSWVRIRFVSHSPVESWKARLSVRVQAGDFPFIFKEGCYQNKILPLPKTDITSKKKKKEKTFHTSSGLNQPVSHFSSSILTWPFPNTSQKELSLTYISQGHPKLWAHIKSMVAAVQVSQQSSYLHPRFTQVKGFWVRIRDQALPQANNAAETRPQVAGLTKQLPSDEQLGQAGQQSQYSDWLL